MFTRKNKQILTIAPDQLRAQLAETRGKVAELEGSESDWMLDDNAEEKAAELAQARFAERRLETALAELDRVAKAERERQEFEQLKREGEEADADHRALVEAFEADYVKPARQIAGFLERLRDFNGSIDSLNARLREAGLPLVGRPEDIRKDGRPSYPLSLTREVNLPAVRGREKEIWEQDLPEPRR
jgi:TolA-binding protein